MRFRMTTGEYKAVCNRVCDQWFNSQTFCVVASELLRLRFKVSNIGFYHLNLAVCLTVRNTPLLQAAPQS